jgi:hypothetical protein
LTLTVLLFGAVSAALASVRPSRAVETAPAPRPPEVEVLELDLAFYHARVAGDSFAARDHAELARLYLQRARAGGADGDLARAERHARRSLALRSGRNEEAIQVLAASLMGQHRFAEARAVAQRLVGMDPTARPARAVLGEIQVELGAYDDARRTFGTLQSIRSDLSIAPR